MFLKIFFIALAMHDKSFYVFVLFLVFMSVDSHEGFCDFLIDGHLELGINLPHWGQNVLTRSITMILLKEQLYCYFGSRH